MHTPSHTDIIRFDSTHVDASQSTATSTGPQRSTRSRRGRNALVPLTFVVAALSGAASMSALGNDSAPHATGTDSYAIAEANRFSVLRDIQRVDVPSSDVDAIDGFTRAEDNRFQTLDALQQSTDEPDGYDRAEQNRFRTLSELQQRIVEPVSFEQAEQNRFETLRDLFGS
ncbi:MAG: hypothetical protein AB8G14_05645 [Ilumatobacter sp.]